MGNISILEVVVFIVFGVLIYLFIRQLNRKKYLGKLIHKVPIDFDTKALMFFWFLFASVWIFFLIVGITYTSLYNQNIIGNLGSYIIWILICILNMLEHMYSKEIRENGITSKEGFIYWKNIIDYRWLVDDQLEITFQLRMPFISSKRKITKIWSVQEDSKENINNIFKCYINNNQV